ncbi:DUF4181 domain-containing protein [Bacillus sp. Marseille-Q1617]|uniref:DUF4181 domain-containing protein n=1 Tax=Bacillus sp. Marseille-Q1617 TaxID=2736887 RepID=UPI00158B7E39|nr:DUF4181 domain-containing protein [Bacillus sp. Marseille-Q1617]
MYGTEPASWLTFVLILSNITIVLFLYNKGIRKLLKVERKKFWSDHHVNDTHKKIDRIINAVFIMLMVIVIFSSAENDPAEGIWLLKPYILPFIFLIVSEAVRACMEKKYAENKNDYLFTISQLVFTSVLLVVLIGTDFGGLFG